MDQEPVVIIGAGPAGVAAAVSLSDLGVTPVLIDRANQVAASWRARYDRLRLDTNKWSSCLPDRPYPKDTPIYPTRDQVADYYEQHAKLAGAAHRMNTTVQRVDPLPEGGWRLQTSDTNMEAQHVVIATGRANAPAMPEWPGIATFAGELLHSSAYRNAETYSGKRVLVVGAGASGMDIACDLAVGGAARVWMAVRTPPNILLRSLPGGFPGDAFLTPLFHLPTDVADTILCVVRSTSVGDLSEFGLPLPEEGGFAAAHRRAISPSIVDMDVIDAIRRRDIEVVPTVASVDTAGVSLVDRRLVDPDVIVAATGYRAGLEPLVGHLDVLDEYGVPRNQAPEPAAPGLWFIGYQLGPTSLGIAGQQSRPLARTIAKELGVDGISHKPDIPGDPAEGPPLWMWF